MTTADATTEEVEEEMIDVAEEEMTAETIEDTMTEEIADLILVTRTKLNLLEIQKIKIKTRSFGSFFFVFFQN